MFIIALVLAFSEVLEGKEMDRSEWRKLVEETKKNGKLWQAGEN